MKESAPVSSSSERFPKLRTSGDGVVALGARGTLFGGVRNCWADWKPMKDCCGGTALRAMVEYAEFRIGFVSSIGSVMVLRKYMSAYLVRSPSALDFQSKVGLSFGQGWAVCARGTCSYA